MEIYRIFVIFNFVVWTILAKFTEKKVSESTVVGSTVFELPRFNDNSLGYTLYEYGDPAAYKHFLITPDGEVKLKSRLKYEIGKTNSILIVSVLRNKALKYGGTAHTVKVLIEDTNDNSPKFDKSIYYGHVEEGMSADTIVAGLEDCFATDKDSSGIAGYTIVEGNNNNEFRVESSKRGDIDLLVLKTNKKLDRDEMRLTPYLDLLVRVNDGGKGDAQKFETTVVRVTIKDKNDNPPVFLHVKWQNTVQENAQIMTSVMKVSASDNDEGQNSEIYYHFKETNDDFVINPATGVINVAAPLNEDVKNIFQLVVIAQDKAVLNPLTAEAYIKIQVLNVPKYPPTTTFGGRNSPPKFPKPKHLVTVRRDVPVMSTIFFVPATDTDPYGPLSRLEYSLSGVHADMFHISRKSGVVTLSTSLKTLALNVVKLTVHVKDGAGERASMEVEIKIQSLDTNLHDPYFFPSTVSLSIPQSINKNTEIGFTARAADRDGSNTDDGKVTYNIVDGSGVGRFLVGKESGKITTSVIFKEPQTYDLYIRAQDNGRYRRTGMLYVQIKVTANENVAPMMSHVMYNASVQENLPANTFVAAVFAKTLTSKKSAIYQLRNSRDITSLALDTNTGVITTTMPLSYEKTKYFSMEVSAFIEGQTESSNAVVSVTVINLNNNPPVFTRSSLTVNVAENSGHILSLVCLFAIDKDGGDVTYSIESGNTGNVFSIDKSTGQLSVKNLDYETLDKYKLVVMATDGKQTTEATVNVNVVDTNDPPHFDRSLFLADLNENSAENTLVQTLGVTSETSGSHLCEWGTKGVTPQILSLFTLTTELRSCVVKVKLSDSIKWSKETTGYEFEVKAINKKNLNEQSSTMLKVKIRDTNDNKPIFAQQSYAVFLQGGSQISQSILQVSAHDGDDGSNGKISYDLEETADSNMFTLKPSGDIFVKSALNEGRKYSLTVNARDQGSPNSWKTSVKVSISVHPTSAQPLSFGDGMSSNEVTESLAINSKITTFSASGATNIEYSIVGGNSDGVFSMTLKNGELMLEKPLDAEKSSSLPLIIRATETTVPPKYAEKLFTVQVRDENDNTPVFALDKPGEEKKIFIDRFSPEGTIIQRVKAFDADSGVNGLVKYSIDGNAPVVISNDGIVSINADIQETIGTQFKYTIVATDSNTRNVKSAQLRVLAQVKAGTKPPVFNPTTFTASLDDNAAIGTELLTITTTENNPSSTTTFQVLSEDLAAHFCIDHNKVLYVQTPIDVDTLKETQLDLKVQMTHGYQTSLASVKVSLIDENDNFPVFEQTAMKEISVQEGSLVDMGIYTVKATDKDRGTNGQIKYSITETISPGKNDNPFRMDEDTGKITLARQLNYEAAGEYFVTVKAEDQGPMKHYALQELKIVVKDINDELPTFSETIYSEVISMTQKPGQSLLHVFASDLDSGLNGKVQYQIVNGDYDGTFTIDSVTGIITLRKPIALLQDKDGKLIKTFTLNIKAKDSGSVALSGQAVVQLRAVIKEGPPKFALPKFVFTTKENKDPSLSLGRATAVSVDELKYTIHKGNENGLFKINAKTGTIYPTRALDAEENSKYLIYVRATDLSERFAESSIEINVENVNDNLPKFRNAVNSLIEAIVPRDSPINTIIVKIDGYDLDIGDRVKYNIIGSARNYFQIGPYNGVIRSLKSFQGLAVGTNQYTFQVQATDTGGFESAAQVRVLLVNKLPGEEIRSVSESVALTDSSIIRKVGGRYIDSVFKIIYPDENPFYINDQSSGNVRIRSKLDYESTKEYTIFIEETNTDDVSDYVTYEVRIQVTDENDNSPVFTMKDLIGKVNRNAQLGTTVLQISVEDEDSGDAGTIDLQLEPDTIPFSIDPFTSEIKTSSWEINQEWYNVTIKATDRGKPRRTTRQNVYIKTGENPPEFQKDVYHFVARENAEPGDFIGRVSARSLSGIPVRYDIESGNQKNLFSIDSQGLITLQGRLDYESGSALFDLIVLAKEHSKSPLESRVNVAIQVTNENDNAPEFTTFSYRPPQPISESLGIGSTILTVTATDKDCGEFGKCAGGLLTYSINQFKDIFKIDPITGAIINIGKLDYETHKEYRFQVEVFDNGDSPLKGVTDVVIPIKNANDNHPIFKPKMADLSMVELIKSGTVIFTVQASDPDNDELTYSIESGGDSNFEIGPKTGVVQITTKGTPSFTQHNYVLNISAYDGLYKDYFALKIRIDDVNDNSPLFEDCAKYKPSVLEQASVGAYVIRVTATDGDRGRNGEIEYELQEPQQEQGALVEPAFRIDNATGEISTNRIFNREQKSSYIVLVIALDGGNGRSTAERNSASCQLEIKIEDINDHVPVFSNPSYDISISEDTSIDQVVIEVSAQDADEGTNAEIVYSIKQASLTPEFKIDPNTGAVSVAQSLIGKNQDWYKFQVEARDKGARPNFASIEIDINVRSSNPPRFKQPSYKTRLSEDVGAGSEVLTVEAVSQDTKTTGKVYYSLLPGNFPSTNKPKTFTIDPETGVIKTSRLLDYEKLKKYDLTVSAKDERGMKSHIKVEIEIFDVNDNSPIFITNYEFGKVSENKPPGQIVEQVNATDLDSGKFGQVTYSLVNSKEGRMFSIDPVTGVIKTKVRFDREQTPRVTFNVRATDGADPPLDNSVAVTVQITDVNDSPPVFLYKQYNKTVMEDVKIGSNVLEIEARDKDAGENARLNYYIVSGNDKGYFGTKSIHRTDGKSIGFVTVEKELDREETETFVLKIAASDYKYDDTTTVIINVKDVNDNNPRFLKLLYNATVPENSAPGIYVTTVSAVDADSPETQQPITYQLAKEATGYFTIDKNKGIITTGPVPFDREEKPVYKFLVFATDGIRFGQSVIKVNVLDRNDEKPVFLDGPYIRKVEENKEPGKAVGYVLAKDRDEKDNAMITYSLRRHTDRFRIEPNTGLIRTKVKLDRESNDNHFKVIVRATDHGEPPLHGETEVTILVDDANDQYPYFEKDVTRVQVPECYNFGDTVTRVVARDNDLGKNAELFYAIARGNSPRHFRIDNKKGIITVARSLDYETEKKRFELFISVRDGGYIELISKKNASVIIDIQDCNDNAPRFSKATYKTNISEGANIGTVVIKVSAQDADSGINKEFDFFIVNPDENYQFDIRRDENNAEIGIVTLEWKLDRETLSEHIIQIGARDRGDAPKTGYAQLTVLVNDVNDNPPSFRPPDFCGHVEEELTGTQQLVTTVHITDPDDPVKNQCPCTFDLIDPYGLFTIDYNKADSYKAFIKTKPNAKFDRDVKDQQLYKIKVKAIDRGGLESTTNVYVEVGDKNDNKASNGGKMTFDVLSYNGKIKNADIGRVLIIDNDRGLNHTYKHRLEPKSESFTINEFGVVQVTELGAEEGNYQFKVVSRDLSGQDVTSSIDINVANIPDEVVQNGFPLRMRGLRKPLTCNEIKYVDFASIISKMLRVDRSQVVVFSVQEARSVYRGVDIWFTIMKKVGADSGYDDVEYMSYMELLTKISEKREELERETGGEILSIGIDACSKETCRDGFCSNVIQGSNKYTTVSDENGIIPAQKSGKSIVTFDVQVLSRCTKQAKGPDLCTSLNSKACLNGGICVPLGSNGYRCKCPSGFDGPQCQVTTRHIKDNGYFWLDTLSSFYEGEIEFEFATQRQSGLLLYHGPITKWQKADISDFLAIDLDNGQLRISVSQGERKVFQKTLKSVHSTLADGVFHHVRIYKREKFIKVVLDRCRYAAIEESWDKPSIQDKSKCELTGTIPGRWKFINGIYPLQVGGVRDYTLGYPNRDVNDRTHRFMPFKGCIRNIIDNGRMYDLRFPLLNYNTELGCSLFTNMFCPACYNGICDMSMLNVMTKSYACQCYHGWMGSNCDQRVEAYTYMSNSYSKYTIMKQPVTWYDRYVTHYKVQVRTKGDGVIVHEEGSRFQRRFEFSTLEIVDRRLHYHFNLGDGNKTLVLSNANITDGMWHNITVHRIGNQATLEMTSNNEIVGRVTGSKGRHQLLDTSGVLYVGGNLYKINGDVEVVDNFRGCIAHNTYQGNYLDRKIGPGKVEQESKYVKIYRENVYKNCSCDAGAASLCLNGGVCIAGSPQYCLCYFGWSGPFCGIKPGDAPLGAPPAMGSNGMMILVVLVLAFLLVLVLVALAVANLSKKNKAIPIYVDDNGRENIMPYNDEGAGEDDFENYDLEKLLMHTGGRDLIFMDEYRDEADTLARANAAKKSAMAAGGTASSNIAVSGADGSGFAGAASALFGASTKSQFIQKDEEKQQLLQAETAVQTENIETTFTSSFKESESAARARFERSRADDIDVAAFINANLTDANNDDAYHPKDTLLHYGYEGQDSDVEDLSDLDFDPDDYDEDDFTFLRQFGAKFYEINILYNPEDFYEEDDV